MIKIERIGTFKGQTVDQASLVSASGVEVDIMNYGVVVRDWRVPVSNGLRSVVLGFEDHAPYPEHSPHFGSIAGRVANRTGFGKFDLDGQSYQLPINEAPHHLHGGSEGLGFQVWDLSPDTANNRVRFTHHSVDGAMGYPGAVTFEALYTLEGNKLRLDLSAKADRRTPISLVQHQYFNLGTGPDVLDHTVKIRAPKYTVSDETLLPTGEIADVTGTDFDFRVTKNMRDSAGDPIDFDLNLVLEATRDVADPVARIEAPDGDLALRLWTDRKGVQFYNSVWTDVEPVGHGGQKYGKYSGFCVEDQSFPNALNHAHFPSIIHSPDHPYSHYCEIEIK